jgi:proteasome lid subunit RPN8/RPN11
VSKSNKQMEKQLSAVMPFVFNGEIPFEPRVWHGIEERARFWTIEYACTLIGEPKVENDEAIVPVSGFFDLPVWQLSRSQGMSFLIDDVVRLAKEKFVVGLLHTHPSGDLTPSSSDWATFTYLDALLGRPLLYMIMSPDKNRKPLIIHFEACHNCPNSFLKILEKIKEKRGEEHGSHENMV